MLIDALGARPWWKGRQPQRLRDAGVEVRPALPVGLFRTFVGRTDLRVHRKIVVVDSEVAWTGSMNLVDPRFFKQDSGVGEWVDAMVRLKGAVVAPLAVDNSHQIRAERISQERLVPSVDGPAERPIICPAHLALCGPRLA
ncbi:MAG: hypothetical protein ACR2QJ_04420 [Geminicoccaceae bacterium]